MKKIIFLSEDDPMIVDIYSKAFGKEGFEVLITHDGQEAKEKLEKMIEPPSVFLLDILMPRMDGFELLKYIKSDSRYRDVPVVFLTNLSSEEDSKKANQLGISMYMVKSDYAPSEVVEEVKKIAK